MHIKLIHGYSGYSSTPDVVRQIVRMELFNRNRMTGVCQVKESLAGLYDSY